MLLTSLPLEEGVLFHSEASHLIPSFGIQQSWALLSFLEPGWSGWGQDTGCSAEFLKAGAALPPNAAASAETRLCCPGLSRSAARPSSPVLPRHLAGSWTRSPLSVPLGTLSLGPSPHAGRPQLQFPGGDAVMLRCLALIAGFWSVVYIRARGTLGTGPPPGGWE